MLAITSDVFKKNVTIKITDLRINTLFILICTDIAFIIIYIFYEKMGWPSSDSFSIHQELGYPEFFQYLKEFWIVLALLLLYAAKRKFIYIAWSLLFLYFLFDDAFRIHERLGREIAHRLDLSVVLGIAPEDLGQVFVSASAGIIPFAAIGLGYYYASSAMRKFSRNLILLVIALVFFGVGTDMLQAIRPWPFFFGIVEDGGEMVVMSIILWYVLLHPTYDDDRHNAPM